MRCWRTLLGTSVVALMLAVAPACSSDGSSGGTGTGGSGGSGGGGQCTGSCAPAGITCTIDPPPGSAAPSVLCVCQADSSWCCGGSSCFDDGGTGGSACPGSTNPAAACRTQADCSSTESCVFPGMPTACGIPCMPDRQCETDTECGTGMVCVEYVDSCCELSGEASSRCQAACSAGSCAEGEACDTSGHCQLVHCNDGYTCPTNTRCDANAEGHGCTRLDCAVDGDCDCGYCAGGVCRDALGACTPPAA